MSIDKTWDSFFSARVKPLEERFPGLYRAEVIDTNDPLNMHRVRFRCPDMHDADLAPQDCPWATPAFMTGGFRYGFWSNLYIGDWIWITFERQHPYGPVYLGAAPATRTSRYPMPAAYAPGTIMAGGTEDIDIMPPSADYFANDFRPMTTGFQDRYGNLDIISSVGYFPTVHNVINYPPTQADENPRGAARTGGYPEVNQPDLKYMARVTKYGNLSMLGDQGYNWINEFSGDAPSDEEFEKRRLNYFQQLLNEKRSGDQRRASIMTRLGHLFEMRDVGWAQKGPIPSKSRKEDFGSEVFLSDETEADFRWIKLRTKGGFLFQAYDKGVNPASDETVTLSPLEEMGHRSEQEDKWWGDRDARQMRLVGRHGFKIVIDERGTHPSSKFRETPRGNGVLIKGRRTAGTQYSLSSEVDRPCGFWWEFNENDMANHTCWGTPAGQSIELNDRYKYAMISSSMGANWGMRWRGIEENEFIGKPLMFGEAEAKSHHLKIDWDNEYIRLKTRGGRGEAPTASQVSTGVAQDEEQQGFEARDGNIGDGPWVEIVDAQRRGLWFSKRHNLSIWRAKRGLSMYQWFDDNRKEIVIFNGDGKIRIHSSAGIEFTSDQDISFKAAGAINLEANNPIRLKGVNGLLTVGNIVQTNTLLAADEVSAFCRGVFAGGGAGPRSPGGQSPPEVMSPAIPQIIEPSDRGQTYNGPFKECPRQEIEHLINPVEEST